MTKEKINWKILLISKEEINWKIVLISAILATFMYAMSMIFFYFIWLDDIAIIINRDFTFEPVLMSANQLYGELINFFSFILAFIGIVLIFLGFLFYINIKTFLSERIRQETESKKYISSIGQEIFSSDEFQEDFVKGIEKITKAQLLEKEQSNTITDPNNTNQNTNQSQSNTEQ